MAIRRPLDTNVVDITGADLASDIAISTTGNIATTGSGTLTVAGASTLTGTTTVNGAFTAPNTTIGGLKSMQVFTSTGTWTKPSGIRTVKFM